MRTPLGGRLATEAERQTAGTAKVAVLSVKFVSRETLWGSRFGPDAYVHWELVKQLAGSKNVLGGCAEWLGMLAFCKWDELSKAEGEISGAHHPLSVLRKNMRECSLDTGGTDAWTLVCKVFVLMLVQGLPSLPALEMLTCAQFKRNTRTGCVELMAKQVCGSCFILLLSSDGVLFWQAEHLFTPGQYETTLSYVLDKCKVDTVKLEQTLALYKASMEDKKLSLSLSRMTVIQGRPRLRDRVTSVLKTDERKAQVDTLLDTWESYTGFSYRHQFAPTLSEKIRSKLYFLASQTRWEWTKYVEVMLPGGGPLCKRVAEHPITQPDLPVLLRVIEALSMDGSPPFKAMTEFRKECFSSFPISHVQRMTLSQILQLYTAAYQSPTVWKQLWKNLIGVLSVQIIRDVDQFVAKHEIDHEAVMRFIINS